MKTLLIGVMPVVTPRLIPCERSHHMKDNLQGGSTPNQNTFPHIPGVPGGILSLRVNLECKLPPVQKWLLRCIADFTNDADGTMTATVGMRELMYHSGLSIVGVQKALKKLESKGHIVVKRTPGHENTYTVKIDPSRDLDESELRDLHDRYTRIKFLPIGEVIL